MPRKPSSANLRGTKNFPLLVACATLSGAAGLVYETAWVRQFANVFGATESALVTILAVYMGGLGLGARLAGSWAATLRSPLAVYAVVEALIAGSALLVEPAIGGFGQLYHAVLGNTPLRELDPLGTGPVLWVFGSLIVLAIPTICMGATIPLLVLHAIGKDGEVTGKVGLLYGWNTLGAAGGAVATPFLLLPALGLRSAIGVGVLLNAVVAITALILSRKVSPPPTAAARPGKRHRNPRWVLVVVMISGAISMASEVAWTRLLGPLLGGTIYSFGVILAIFLAGIGGGSALARRLGTSREHAARSLSLLQSVAALSALTMLTLASVGPDLLQLFGRHTVPGDLASIAFAALLTLPAALCLGAIFPLAVRVRAEAGTEAFEATSQAYVWNTVGAIAGTVGAGLWLLPAMEFAGTLKIIAAAGLLNAAFAAHHSRGIPFPAIAAPAILSVLTLALPIPEPMALVQFQPLQRKVSTREAAFYKVGRTSTVVLQTNRFGGLSLFTNGLPESTIQPKGARPKRYALAHWMALLPAALRPEARSMLVIGLGGGLTVEDVPDSIDSVDVVELEPQVVRANRSVASWRRKDPLSDPRVAVRIDDARSTLQLTSDRFDIIVSQPSHPWTPGGAGLFTAEFFGEVQGRLTERGVFCQWIGLAHVDQPLLEGLLATLRSVFPHVHIYAPPPGAGLLLMASNQDLTPEVGQLQRAIEFSAGIWSDVGVRTPEGILAAWIADNYGVTRLAFNGRISTDSYNILEIFSPGARKTPMDAAAGGSFVAAVDPLVEAMPRDTDPVQLVRKLLYSKNFPRVYRLIPTLPNLAERRIARGLASLAQNDPVVAARTLWQVVREDPESRPAMEALITMLKSTVSQENSPPQLEPLIDRFPSTRTIVNAWRDAEREDWESVSAADTHLEQIPQTSLLYRDALRLRAGWRIQTRRAEAAQEALVLLDPVFDDQTFLSDVILEIRAAEIAGRPYRVKARLHDAMSMLESIAGTNMQAGQWLAELGDLLDRVDIDEADPSTGSRLHARRRQLEQSMRSTLTGTAAGDSPK